MPVYHSWENALGAWYYCLNISDYVTAINHFEFIFLLDVLQALVRWQKK
jgi:hypothetical protein